MGMGFQMGQILWDFISVWDMACMADGMANSVDPDGAEESNLWSRSFMFFMTCLPEYLEKLRY